MNTADEKVQVTVEDVKNSAPGDASVVIETESRVNGRLRETSIEVREVDAAAVAVALLNPDTDPDDSSPDVDLPAAVRCLGAGVVHVASDGQVRVHLQFESGQVLPIEMSRAAAMALCRGLSQHIGASTLQ